MNIIGGIRMTEEIIRKCVVVFGKFSKEGDFVLEPVCIDCEVKGNECDVCKNYIYIKEVRK